MEGKRDLRGYRNKELKYMTGKSYSERRSRKRDIISTVTLLTFEYTKSWHWVNPYFRDFQVIVTGHGSKSAILDVATWAQEMMLVSPLTSVQMTWYLCVLYIYIYKLKIYTQIHFFFFFFLTLLSYRLSRLYSYA